MSDPTMHGSSGDWNKLKHLVDLSAENARLKAELYDATGHYNGIINKLEAEVGELADALKLASEVGIKIADEVTRLKAEVERLRASSFVTAVPVEQYERVIKAGDAMADEIIGCYNAEGYDPADSETLLKWNAAKEGKQP